MTGTIPRVDARIAVRHSTDFCADGGPSVNAYKAKYATLYEKDPPGELSAIDDLRPGQGAIVRRGVMKIAAYRDDAGALYARSATCAHLACHLHWNSFESCWDCPCHGSQFAVDGTAINAPAVASLAKATE